jgi:membrane protease YdiL (CAAX protease family)
VSDAAEVRCFVCRAAMDREARFCGACGRPTRAHHRAVVGRQRDSQRRVFRAALALGAVVVAVFVGLSVSTADEGTWAAVLEQVAVLGVAAVVGSAVLGRGDAPPPVPPRAALGAWLAALPMAAATLLVSLVYVAVLGGLLAEAPADPIELPAAEASAAPLWVAVVLVAPIGEELLCRGIAWRAGLRLSGPGTATLVAAVLFAFLHGLGGGYLFELPHRFVAGLAFGTLRWWGGRLGPAILAHALHNAACLLLGD